MPDRGAGLGVAQTIMADGETRLLMLIDDEPVQSRLVGALAARNPAAQLRGQPADGPTAHQLLVADDSGTLLGMTKNRSELPGKALPRGSFSSHRLLGYSPKEF